MTRPLHIVRVLPFFAEGFGGPVQQAMLTSAELARRGHDVRIITSDLGVAAEVPRQRWLQRCGYQVLHLAAGRLSAWPPYLPPRTFAPALAEALAAAELLWLNVGLNGFGVRAAAAARRAGVPYGYCAEGALDPVRLQHKRWQKRVFLALWERRVLRDAAALQAANLAERDDLVRQGASIGRVHVIPNGVELPAPNTAAARAAARTALGLPATATVVLFLGRLHHLKGIDLALAAMRPLFGELPDLQFVIAGPDGGERQCLQQLVLAEPMLSPRVRFEDAAYGPRKAQLLAAADVFALTSRSEGLPNAALEAAAAGLPLWLSTACRLPEVVEFDAGSVDAAAAGPLTTSLRRLITEVARRRRCGENARAMVRARFLLQDVVDRLEALFAGLRR